MGTPGSRCGWGKGCRLHMQRKAKGLVPDPQAQFPLPNRQVLKAGDPVVTYAARNLEPYQGFHVFMRSLRALLAAHPTCQVLIVGGDEVSDGKPPSNARNWREAMLSEVTVDPKLVHFLGKLPYAQYRLVLQVSAVHMYLTYPFVLSWSLLEALASGCVVVASDTAPVREVIRHGENGLLVDFFDGAQLVKAVHKVLADPIGMQGIRKAAMESVKARFAQAAATAGYLYELGLPIGPSTLAKQVSEISLEEI